MDKDNVERIKSDIQAIENSDLLHFGTFTPEQYAVKERQLKEAETGCKEIDPERKYGIDGQYINFIPDMENGIGPVRGDRICQDGIELFCVDNNTFVIVSNHSYQYVNGEHLLKTWKTFTYPPKDINDLIADTIKVWNVVYGDISHATKKEDLPGIDGQIFTLNFRDFTLGEDFEIVSESVHVYNREGEIDGWSYTIKPTSERFKNWIKQKYGNEIIQTTPQTKS